MPRGSVAHDAVQLARALGHPPGPRRIEERRIADVAGRHDDDARRQHAGPAQRLVDRRTQALGAGQPHDVVAAGQQQHGVEAFAAAELVDDVDELRAVPRPVDDQPVGMFRGDQPRQRRPRRTCPGTHGGAVADDQQAMCGRLGRRLERLAGTGQFGRSLDARRGAAGGEQQAGRGHGQRDMPRAWRGAGRTVGVHARRPSIRRARRARRRGHRPGPQSTASEYAFGHTGAGRSQHSCQPRPRGVWPMPGLKVLVGSSRR